MHHKMQCDTETFIYDLTHRCKQHRVSVGDTITANTELPGVMRVTPAGVTLVVVGEPTLRRFPNHLFKLTTGNTDRGYTV